MLGFFKKKPAEAGLKTKICYTDKVSEDKQLNREQITLVLALSKDPAFQLLQRQLDISRTKAFQEFTALSQADLAFKVKCAYLQGFIAGVDDVQAIMRDFEQILNMTRRKERESKSNRKD